MLKGGYSHESAEYSLMAHVHICAPQGERFAHAGTCLDCGKRTRFIGVSYLWYGPDKVCLRCGRRWSDGEWMPLDFVPQSRQKSIDGMKATFRRAGGPGTIKRLLDEEMGAD